MACCCVAKFFFYGIALYLGYIFLVPYPQLKLQPHSYTWSSPPPFLGPLTRNTYLEKAERLFENKISPGPESVVVKDGTIYTGTLDGSINKITGDKMETIATTSPNNCVAGGLPHDPNACGRPLGLRFNSQGDLIIADCVKGLLKLDLKTKKLTTLFAGNFVVDGVASNFIDDVTIAKNGDMYISDADSKWNFMNVVGSLLEIAPNGRILHYDAKTQKVTTLLDHLYFPNGVQLSPNEDSLIFSNSMRSQIMKYHLKGAKEGQLEVMIDNLPGIPDNIRASGRGTYWVALHSTRNPEQPSLNELVSKCTCTKRIIFTGMLMMHGAAQMLHDLLGLSITNMILEQATDCLWKATGNNKYGMILEIDDNGQILRSLHAPNGRLTLISHVSEYQGYLYVGSPHNSFVGKVALPETIETKKAKAA